MKLKLNIDVEDFLKRLKVEQVSSTNNEVNFACPFHHDNTPSARMNKKSYLWFCHGCKKGGNIAQFLADIENIPLARALYWIKYNFTGFQQVEGTLLEEIDQELERQRRAKTKHEFKAHIWTHQDYIALYGADWIEPNHRDARYYEYMVIQRNFNPLVLGKYAIGIDRKRQRITIPIYNEFNQIVGIKGRTLDNYKKPRYLIYDPIYSPSDFVYLIGTLSDKTSKPIILVEGELNALMMRQYGYLNCVALGGSHLSSRQATMLRDLGRAVVLYFDPDEAGFHGAIDAAEKLDPYTHTFIVQGHRADPCDSSERQIKSHISQAKSLINTIITNKFEDT